MQPYQGLGICLVLMGIIIIISGILQLYLLHTKWKKQKEGILSKKGGMKND